MSNRIVLFGPPGAGKGTLGIGLSVALSIPHISSGDLLRQVLAEDENSELGRAARVITAGGMVTDGVAFALISREIEKPIAEAGYILDGYPRNVAQAERLDAYLEATRTALEAAILLEIDEATLVDRLMGRLTCPNCGETFHVRNAPPKVAGICDRCGSELEVREDDQPNAIRTRLRLYSERTTALFGFYMSSGRLLIVDGSGTGEEVLERTLNLLCH